MCNLHKISGMPGHMHGPGKVRMDMMMIKPMLYQKSGYGAASGYTGTVSGYATPTVRESNAYAQTSARSQYTNRPVYGN